ncbi:hypothetical protein ACFQZF_15095 [Flavobacterium myungsuense]|uniref:CBM-cenC domain-containing protein n=1 Tax=Flavobacterium myungsuense TaxID=651823 RepID=A0ABW3J5V0_9FLAO
MKKLFLLLFLMTISLGQSQNLITNGDFESGTVGWNGNALNIIGTTNKYNSASVGAAGNAYDVNLSYAQSISAIKYKLTFDASTDRPGGRTMVAGIGLQGAPYDSAVQTVNLTTTSQTFELVLNSYWSNSASRIIFDMGAAVGQVDIDNVKLEVYVAPDPAPTAGPAAPTRNAGDVRSVYGTTYTNPDTYILSTFGGSTITEPYSLADASTVIKYSNHSYSGLAANGSPDPVGGNWDASTMTHLHIDVWSPDFVSFKIKLESIGGGNRELEVPFTKVQGSWNSYDIDLSTYTSGGGVDLSRLKWIVPVTFGPNNVLLYNPLGVII